MQAGRPGRLAEIRAGDGWMMFDVESTMRRRTARLAPGGVGEFFYT